MTDTNHEPAQGASTKEERTCQYYVNSALAGGICGKAAIGVYSRLGYCGEHSPKFEEVPT